MFLNVDIHIHLETLPLGGGKVSYNGFQEGIKARVMDYVNNVWVIGRQGVINCVETVWNT